MVADVLAGTPDATGRRRLQRAWNWYDWASSGYYTTVLAVLFPPLMISVAGKAAGCATTDDTCSRTVSLLGLHLAAGSLPSYLTSFATIVSALLLPIVGVFVDRSPHRVRNMALFAWAGSIACALLFLLQGGSWQLGAFAIVVSSILGGCSLVSYYAILVDISTEAERDQVSARGWAFGYIGGGTLLALDLVLVLLHGSFGLDKELAVRLALFSAGLWWGGFTLIPYLRLRGLRSPALVPRTGSALRIGFGQLFATLREVRRYPMTMRFLLAYLFYNDGIQTVITSASTYGAKQLGIGESILIAAILMIQFVAFGGALFFARLASRFGSYRSILWGTFAWMVIVTLAMFLPRHNIGLFMTLGVAIAIVLGGTQALSRSFFSLLIPRGREGEYFALYNAAERGTSWFGTMLFGVVFQVTGSYRPAIVSLIVFFVLGAYFLLRLDPARGIAEAGNAAPSAV